MIESQAGPVLALGSAFAEAWTEGASVQQAVGRIRDDARPLGIAENQLLETLPEPLRTSLPTIEQLELELELGESHP